MNVIQKIRSTFNGLFPSFSHDAVFILFSLILIILIFLTSTPLTKAENVQTVRVYSDFSDGVSKFLGSPNNHTWSDVRNSPFGNQKYDNMTVYYKGILSAYNAKNGGIYVVSRSYFPFDTSFLKESDVIVNVTLNIYGEGANQSRVCVVEWLDGEDGVDYEDYGLTGSINFGVSLPWKTESYNQIILNEKGIEYINKNGITYVACREYDHDFLNINPAESLLAEYRNGHYFADEPGMDKDPYLRITYKSINDGSNNDKNDTSFIGTAAFLFMVSLIVFVKKYYKK